MAKFNSYLLGKVTKSVGNVTMCYMNKQNIARAKIFSRKDNPTPKVLDQRARMKVLIELSHCLLPVIRKGFTGVGNGTTSNAFVSTNMGAVSVDEKHVATMDYERMAVSFGELDVPVVSVTYGAETSKYLFEQEAQEEESGYALSDDLVYAVLFETVLKRVKMVALRNRGESGSTSFALPGGWDNTKVQAYCFATSVNGRLVSGSRNLVIG